jgi:hypothetical protein
MMRIGVLPPQFLTKVHQPNRLSKRIISHSSFQNVAGVSINKITAKGHPLWSQFSNLYIQNTKSLPFDMYDVRKSKSAVLKALLPSQSVQLENDFSTYYSGTTPDSYKNAIDQLNHEEKNMFMAILPFRRRAHSQLSVNINGRGDIFNIRELQKQPFTQKVTDNRLMERNFNPVSPSIIFHPFIKDLLQEIVTILGKEKPVQEIDVHIHQVGHFTRSLEPIPLVPEGIHQDGFNYILGALVIDRQNILGGESQFFEPDLKEVRASATLIPSEGLFHKDAGTDLWHNATPIQSPSGRPGHRIGLGLDVTVIK